MPHSKFQQKSLLLLLPLGLLAIVSYALDKRIPTLLDIESQTLLLEVCRIILPGCFAIAAACMVPTFNRMFQIISVALVYAFLVAFSLSKYQNFFTQPTSWIISSLVATLFLLPNNDIESEGLSFKAFLSKIFCICTFPFISLFTIMVVVKNIEHSILITFTSVFLDTFLSCLFVPIYEIMLTLGFSSLLNSLVSLQSENEIIHAMLNSIMLVNMISLPAIIITRASFAKSYNRLFLVFLSFIACLTSKIGSCISVELLIIMFFYPGTFLALCFSSIFMFFLNLYLQIGTFTSFYMLYQPDLILRNLAFLQLSTSHFVVIAFSIFIPFAMQTLISKIGKINHLKNKLKRRFKNSGFNLKDIKNPDLFLISILNGIGGKSNLKAVWLDKEVLFIKVFDYKKVIIPQINLISKRRIEFIRSENNIRIPLGALSYIVWKRLNNIIEESANYTSDEVELSDQFDIKGYVLNLQEKK
ncbi:hypothetical protein SAMN02745213_02368 [Succinivibrio dextrinosolvens DSM 3072]|jgi:hypothetical protein|uniref:Uncharacterized protein n=1 Tax=Succinivibrio dextrinosolvens DSM 3072 TaxID=1123324 RepID=A0A1T4W0Z2_9GAMM|nr:hypothetical protein SAMN02745213_02368 [Succinivibrio dextrinosolvens DSM 3072]